MRAITIAHWMLMVVYVYVVFGVVFAALFLTLGIKRVDAASIGAPVSFKLVILPGVIALWPLLLIRWLVRGRA